MTIGTSAAILGVGGIFGGFLTERLSPMFVGRGVAGVASGGSFTATLQLTLSLAAPNERAGVVSATYTVSYLSFGIPIAIAGQLSGNIGTVPTVVWHAVATLALALLSLAARQLETRRPIDLGTPESI